MDRTDRLCGVFHEDLEGDWTDAQAVLQWMSRPGGPKLNEESLDILKDFSDLL